MKRKPIKIDWDELESAFENKREDLLYYLDLVTGQVILDGEGEEDDFEGDENELLEEVDEPASRDESTRLYIEPPTPDDELAWMEEFVDESGELEAEIQSKFREVLERENLDAFRDALRGHADVRERWFVYRSDRLHDAIDAWLGVNDVNASDSPPWR